MDNRGFVRTMATGVSRRSVLRRAASSMIAGPITLFGVDAAAADGKNDKDKEKKKDKDNGNQRGSGGGCRDVGHPCMGNQECCAGLECIASGPGSVLRCSAPMGITLNPAQTEQTVVQTNNQVCAGDNCSQTNQQAAGGQLSQTVVGGSQELFGRPPTYWIDVACTFDAPLYRTICDCTGRGVDGAPPIRKISLPAAEICAFVIAEEMRPAGERPRTEITEVSGGEASAGTGGVANADASGGSVTVGDVRGDDTNVAIDASGGTASADASGGDNNVAIAGGGQIRQDDAAQGAELSKLTLTLEGNVVPGRPATYWVETDRGRRPASGPALVQVAEEPNNTGAVIAEAWLCGIAEPQPEYDWFGQCTTPMTDMSFNLYAESDATTPLATATTNAQGRARFGDLPPGTYQLEPSGALGGDGDIWCYAESDRVDANGNVLVEADLESHVWSFVCGGPRGS